VTLARKPTAIERALKSVVLALLCCVLLPACGMFGIGKEKEPDQPIYYEAAEAPSLQIPEGLDRPKSSNALMIATPLAPLPQRELQTIPPRVASHSTRDNSTTQLKWSAEGVYLLVADSSESVVRRLGIVIPRAGMSLFKTEVPNGYQFEYRHNSKDPDEGWFSKMAFWRDDAPNYSGIYQAVALSDGQNTRIVIKGADGTEVDPIAAEHILGILGERLG